MKKRRIKTVSNISRQIKKDKELEAGVTSKYVINDCYYTFEDMLYGTVCQKILFLYAMKRMKAIGMDMPALPRINEYEFEELDEFFYDMDSYFGDFIMTACQQGWDVELYNHYLVTEEHKSPPHEIGLVSALEDEHEDTMDVFVLSSQRFGRFWDYALTYPDTQKRGFYRVIKDNLYCFMYPLYCYLTFWYESYLLEGTCFICIGVGSSSYSDAATDINKVSALYPLYLYHLNCLLDIAEREVPAILKHKPQQKGMVKIDA